MTATGVRLPRPAWRAAAELAVAVAALSFHLWTDSRQIWGKPARAATTAGAVAALAVLLVRSRPSRADLGLAPRSWTAGLGMLTFGTAAAAGAVFALGAGRPFSPLADLGYWAAQVFLLEGGQQALLHAVLRPRLDVLLPHRPRAAAVSAAALFALLHLPNPLLVPTTFVAALLWQAWFRRYRNLPALWASHWALGAALFAAWDGPWLRRLRVGIAWCYPPS